MLSDFDVFVLKIHADLAVLPSSTACGKPDTQMINLLRHALLQVGYDWSSPSLTHARDVRRWVSLELEIKTIPKLYHH